MRAGNALAARLLGCMRADLSLGFGITLQSCFMVACCYLFMSIRMCFALPERMV